jgi:hypothetical protein
MSHRSTQRHGDDHLPSSRVLTRPACQSARSIAYQATLVPAIATSPWKRNPHFAITRRHAALVAIVALMIRSSPATSNP